MPSDEHELLPLGTGFDVVRRGYDRGQVEEHLDRVEADLRILTADRDAAVAQATELARALDHHRAYVEDLRAQVDRLSAPPDTMEGLSERLQRMLRLAQDETRAMRERRRRGGTQRPRGRRRVRPAQAGEADEHARTVIAGPRSAPAARSSTPRSRPAPRSGGRGAARGTLDEARRQAREMHERAEADAEQARTRYDAGLADNDRRRAAMEDEHRELMEGARAEAARICAREAEQERDRLDAECRATRDQVENDFAVAMSARRREAMRQLEADEQASSERAEQHVQRRRRGGPPPAARGRRRGRRAAAPA